MAEAARRGHTIRFSVMYYATAASEIKNELGAKEGELIRALRPPLNYQIPKEDNWCSYTTNPAALTITLSDLLERDSSV
jgi:hypothetical protein